MKKLIITLLALTILLSAGPDASASVKFNKKTQKTVDQIYKTVSTEKNWEKYGSLPSVCIAQAFVESGIGNAGRKNNLWGLGGGRYSYKSLKDGIYAYMKCINKRFYTRYGATDTKRWKKQIRAILKGGYCVPAAGYYNKVERVIKAYGLEKYDRKMFSDIKAARKARVAKAEAKAKAAKEKKNREIIKNILQNIPSNASEMFKTTPLLG